MLSAFWGAGRKAKVPRHVPFAIWDTSPMTLRWPPATNVGLQIKQSSSTFSMDCHVVEKMRWTGVEALDDEQKCDNPWWRDMDSNSGVVRPSEQWKTSAVFNLESSFKVSWNIKHHETTKMTLNEYAHRRILSRNGPWSSQSSENKNTRISNKRGYSKFLAEFQGASSESSCSCVEGTYLWNGRCEALFYVVGEISHGFFKRDQTTYAHFSVVNKISMRLCFLCQDWPFLKSRTIWRWTN